MSRSRYVIIGNSAAAVGAVTAIREADREGSLTLLAREREHTYSRPLISYLLAGLVDESRMSYRGEDFYRINRVEALLGVEATGIDEASRAVLTADGRRIEFETLLIATGGAPVIPRDLAGADARGVFTFTTWEDARRIRAWIDPSDPDGASGSRRGEAHVRRAVVVGGGLIGLKAVEALAELKIETVVVELADRILAATFDRTASDLASKYLRKAGVAVRCSTTVSEIRTEDGRVAAALLRDGTRLDCEMLILAIGVAPDVRVANGTSIRLDRGILVDETMQTSVKGVYAAGDVAEAADLLSGKSRPIPILPIAYRQGAVAGANMAGRPAAYKGGLAMNAVDICGLPTISVGMTSLEGEGIEVLSRLDEEKGVYKKLVLKDRRLVGAIFVGDIDRAGIATGLIREKVDVSAFKHLLLSEEFGVLSLPEGYRKHVVSGQGIEV